MVVLWWAVAMVGPSLFGVVMMVLWWAVAMVGPSLVWVAGIVVGPAKAGWFPVWGRRSRSWTRRGIVGSCSMSLEMKGLRHRSNNLKMFMGFQKVGVGSSGEPSEGLCLQLDKSPTHSFLKKL